MDTGRVASHANAGIETHIAEAKVASHAGAGIEIVVGTPKTKKVASLRVRAIRELEDAGLIEDITDLVEEGVIRIE